MDDAVRSAVMDLAVDDHTGLWELRWRMASLFPDDADLARDVVGRLSAGLIAEGLIELHEQCGGDDPARIPTGAALELLADPDAWDAPGPDRELTVAATEAGLQAYREGRFA